MLINVIISSLVLVLI